MVKINLRIYYAVLCTQDAFCEVPEQIHELLNSLHREEHAQQERRRYHGDSFSYIKGVSDQALEVFSPSLEEQYDKDLQRETLYKAIRKLPPVQMRRIYAHYFLELSLTQIARAEGVSVAAVSSSLMQAIKNLRRYLSEE